MADADDAVLGVSIAAGVAYLVLVRRPAEPQYAVTAKISPPGNVDHWSALSGFGERLVADARAHHIACVAFADPRKYNQWSYNDARARVELVTAGALALRAARIQVEVVSQRTAASAIDLPFNKELHETLAAKFVGTATKVVHWKERAPALLVALYMAGKLWP